MNKCRVCGLMFENKLELVIHKETHASEKRAKRLDENGVPRKRGRPSEFMEKEHFCDICHKGFTKKIILQKHMIIHEVEKLNKCKNCGAQFEKKMDLLIHRGRCKVKRKMIKEEYFPRDEDISTMQSGDSLSKSIDFQLPNASAPSDQNLSV